MAITTVRKNELNLTLDPIITNKLKQAAKANNLKMDGFITLLLEKGVEGVAYKERTRKPRAKAAAEAMGTSQTAAIPVHNP